MLWTVAVAIDYAGPAWLTRERLRGLQQVAVAHFAERYSLFVIICLGESIVAIGLSANEEPMDADLIAAVTLGLLATIGLWWTYFDRFAAIAEARLRDHDDPVLAAADGYSYLHLVIVAGIIIFAVGMKSTIHELGEPLSDAARLALCGGLALYLLGNVGVPAAHGRLGRLREAGGCRRATRSVRARRRALRTVGDGPRHARARDAVRARDASARRLSNDFAESWTPQYAGVMTSGRRAGVTGLAVLCLLAFPGTGLAEPRGVDPTFGNHGRTFIQVGYGGLATAAAVQPDDKIVLAGYRYTEENQAILVARLLPNGTLDTSFGGDGIVTTEIDLVAGGGDRAFGVALGPGGTVVVGGEAENTGGSALAFVRYTPAGALDTSFGVGGISTADVTSGADHARDVAVDSAGRILAAGWSWAAPWPAWKVVRL